MTACVLATEGVSWSSSAAGRWTQVAMIRTDCEPRLRCLLRPQSIALVGASSDTSTIRGRLVKAVVDGGYRGAIYPVTRSHDRILDLPCYPSVASLPETPELAIIMVPAMVVGQWLEACGEKGVRAVVILSSGFNEQGDEEGRSRQTELGRIANRYGMLVCGPNAEGFYSPTEALIATFSPALRGQGRPKPITGPGVGIVSQSGGIGFAIYNRGEAKGMQTSAVVSTGNEVDVEISEVADYLLDDPQTAVIALFLEGLKNPQAFSVMAERAAELRKPIVVAKTGRSQAAQRASLSHTGALAGSFGVYQSVLRAHGVTLADDLQELVDVSQAFAHFRGRAAGGRRVAVLTASGGAGIWVIDACVEKGLQVAELDEPTRTSLEKLMPAYGSSANPVDITAQGVVRFGFSTPLEILLASPSVDMVVVVTSAIVADSIVRDAEALASVADRSEKPVMFCAYTLAHRDVVNALIRARFPITETMGNAASALKAWADYHHFLESRRSKRHRSQATVDERVLTLVKNAPPVLCEYRAREVLSVAGVTLGKAWLARTEAEAIAYFHEAGCAVALKLQSAVLIHKSDVGGVSLGLDDDQAVREAFSRIVTTAHRYTTSDDIEGVLVQPMARGGIEMIVGVNRDPDFGPMLLLGLGGIWVEVLADVQLEPVPVDRTQARAMIERLKGKALLHGARGAQPVDIEALCDLMVKVSDFAYVYREQIAEIDLNPVIVHSPGQGLTIADALMVKPRAVERTQLVKHDTEGSH